MNRKFDMALAVLPHSDYEGLTRSRNTDLFDLIDDNWAFPVLIDTDTAYVAGFISDTMVNVYLQDKEHINVQIQDVTNRLVDFDEEGGEYTLNTNGATNSYGSSVYQLGVYLSK